VRRARQRTAGVRWSGHARLWRRRGNVHSPHAAHMPGFPAEGAYPETYGTGGESRSGMQGRWVWWCLRIVGGGIDGLSSFLVASGWKLGRGSSYGRTADPRCPRFTWASPQRARSGRRVCLAQVGSGVSKLGANQKSHRDELGANA
jgi:hypothetical protein